MKSKSEEKSSVPFNSLNSLPGWVREHPAEPEVVLIPEGNFWMGTDPAHPEMVHLDAMELLQDEIPYHQLYLPAYAIGRYPVTNVEYAYFINDGGYNRPEFWTNAGWQERILSPWTVPRGWIEGQSGGNYPVVGVSWYEAVAYCHWLSQVTGRFYRLASEAEWEKAARGPDGNLWPWGNTWQPDCCNTAENGPDQVTLVGSYAPAGDSPYGVSDMVGNVWEWCTTRFSKPYPYELEDEWNDSYLEGLSVRILRGASRLFGKSFARCARRDQNVSSYADNFVGFRIVTFRR